SLALSPDLSTLYVASAGSNTINTINLNTRQRGNDYNVGSRPDAIAVGNDGKVVILGTGGLQRLDTATGRITPVPISPPPTPPGGLLNIPGAIITTSTFAGLVTTASGNLIIGRSINLTTPHRPASSFPVAAVDSPGSDLGAVVFRRHRHKANRQWQSSRFCARQA